MMSKSPKRSVSRARLGGITRPHVTLAEEETTWEQAWALEHTEQGWDREHTWAVQLANSDGGYPHGVAGKSTGYGDGATGYLGGTAGNGYGGDAGAKALSAGYGNGYGDGYRAELADGAENKAGKSQALTAGTYAGQVQGAYGGGAAQGPYGNGPVIPAGLEGDGAYPYAPQQLGLGLKVSKPPTNMANSNDLNFFFKWIIFHNFEEHPAVLQITEILRDS
ncbi:hypothetical protein INR49_030475 [Caranx melampygus]|nr:hypothetical protein INR49_030475 [Caranx melampygus]